MTRARDVANLIGSGNYSSTTFTATAGQTAFTISHTQGFIQVFMNGLLLDETVDYTSNGSAVTLTSGAAAGDEIEVVAYNTFSVGDALNQAAADTRYVNTSGDTMTGNLGINETSPSGSLHVKGTSSTHGKIILEAGGSGGSANNNFMEFNKHDGTKLGELEVGESVTNGGSLVFKTTPSGGSATSRMTINHDGHVTKSNQPQFIFQGSYNGWTTINQSGHWLTLTGNTGVATSTNYEIAMNWTSSRSGGYNPSGNGINATTGVYTAPVTGTYMFALQAYVLKQDSGTEYYHINSFINGTNQMDYTIYGYNMGSTTYSTPEITKVIRLSANDTFAFRLYTNQSASFKILPHYTCLAGYLLS